MPNIHQCLLVIIPDALSALIEKGEITPRYYNPGNLFQEVHILLTNDDHVDPELVQPMVGTAKLVIHNIDQGQRFLHRTLGWQRWCMRAYLSRVLELAKEIQPSLIRTHNNFLEGYLASSIKKHMGIPYVTSLHGVWDRDPIHPNMFKDRIIRLLRHSLEKSTLTNADAIIAVYKPILRYAQRFGGRNIHVVYNAVASDIKPKKNYKLNSPPSFITVNRQLPEKNPENIIRAIADIDCTYTLVGTGPYHEHLKQVAHDAGCSDKVTFIEAMANERLCKMLPKFDLMLSHCDYWGISKTTIEAALAGLPVIINRHPKEPIPDLEGQWVVFADNTPESYHAEITDLLEDHHKRQQLGINALSHAQSNFNPTVMEKRIVDIYRSVLMQ